MTCTSLPWKDALLSASAWHKRNVKVALRSVIDESLIVADLDMAEWSPLILPRPKYGCDHAKHTIKGITFHATSETAYFVKMHGRKCVNCGAPAMRLVVIRPNTKELKNNYRALGRLSYITQIGKRWYPLTVDHIAPASKGGGNSRHNKQILCLPCNQIKGYYRDVIPFASYVVPSNTLKERLKIWKRLVIKWGYLTRVPILTNGS